MVIKILPFITSLTSNYSSSDNCLFFRIFIYILVMRAMSNNSNIIRSRLNRLESRMDMLEDLLVPLENQRENQNSQNTSRRRGATQERRTLPLRQLLFIPPKKKHSNGYLSNKSRKPTSGNSRKIKLWGGQHFNNVRV